MFFPLFSSSRGTEVCQYGQLSSNHPLKLSLWWSWGTPALHCGRHQPQPRTTLQIYSDKLVYAAEWMSKTKYFLGRRKQKKKVKEEVIFERRREEVTWWKKMGTGLRSGTARFLMGSLPSAPWEVRSSALQAHEGHHLLQLEGQPLFPGCIVLLQCTHNLPRWGKHKHNYQNNPTNYNQYF